MIVAPAMNVNMWNHPATQANVRLLRERGTILVEGDYAAVRGDQRVIDAYLGGRHA